MLGFNSYFFLFELFLSWSGQWLVAVGLCGSLLHLLETISLMQTRLNCSQCCCWKGVRPGILLCIFHAFFSVAAIPFSVQFNKLLVETIVWHHCQLWGYFSSAREAVAITDSISKLDFKNSIEWACENLPWMPGY